MRSRRCGPDRCGCWRPRGTRRCSRWWRRTSGDVDPDVRVAVLAAMVHLGDDAGPRAGHATRSRGSPPRPIRRSEPSPRGCSKRATRAAIDRAPLAALLVDARPRRRQRGARRDSVGRTTKPCSAEVTARLGDRATVRGAVDALVRAGEPGAGRGGRGPGRGRGGLGGCRSTSPASLATSVGRRPSPSSDGTSRTRTARSGLAVLSALGALVSTAASRGVGARGGRRVPRRPRRPRARDAHPARARAPATRTRPPRACRRRCATSSTSLNRRVLAGLGARHGDDALERVSFQFAKGDGRSHALAVEWLDVTLTGTDRAAVALLEPGLSDAERLRRLTRALPLPELSLEEVLVDLITDPEQRWRQPWVQACALHAAWSTPDVRARPREPRPRTAWSIATGRTGRSSPRPWPPSVLWTLTSAWRSWASTERDERS